MQLSSSAKESCNQATPTAAAEGIPTLFRAACVVIQKMYPDVYRLLEKYASVHARVAKSNMSAEDKQLIKGVCVHVSVAIMGVFVTREDLAQVLGPQVVGQLSASTLLPPPERVAQTRQLLSDKSVQPMDLARAVVISVLKQIYANEKRSESERLVLKRMFPPLRGVPFSVPPKTATSSSSLSMAATASA